MIRRLGISLDALRLDGAQPLRLRRQMTADIIIRSATPEDLPTLLTFEQGIIRAERPYDHMLKPNPISYYDVGALIVDPDAEVAVVEMGP